MEDFLCPSCQKLLHSPVSTTCGHTFCRSCLQKLTKNSKNCPVCELSFDFSNNPAITYTIQSFIEKNYPKECKIRKTEEIEENSAKDYLNLPILFVYDIVCFPEVYISFKITDRKRIPMILNELSNKSVFAVLSDVKGLWAGFSICFYLIFEDDESVTIRGLCKNRLLLDFIRNSHGTIEIPVSMIGFEQLNDLNI